MPSMMLIPLAWLSVLTNVPIIVPMATAARPKASNTASSAPGGPQLTFITSAPKPTRISICTIPMPYCPVIVPSR